MSLAISELSELLTLLGTEYVEVISSDDGGETFLNFRIPVESLRGQQGVRGKSAYQVAVDEGYTGSESAWLTTLIGRSAYQVAVSRGFEGDIDEWLLSLQGLSAYQVALVQGFTGTQAEWLGSLIGPTGQSAYQSAVALGYSGTQQQWLESLVGPIGETGESAYQVAVRLGYSGTEAEWVTSLIGPRGLSAYEVAVQQGGFVGSVTEWIEYIRGPAGINGADGKSAYDLAVEGGFVGDLASWILSLTGPEGPQGTAGDPGPAGEDGPAVEFNVSATHIQWRVVGGTEWTDLIAKDDIRGADGVAVPAPVMIVTESRPLDLTDASQYLAVDSVAPVTLTLTNQATTAWAPDTEIHIQQIGDGQVEIDGVAVNIITEETLKTRKKGSPITLKRLGVDLWTVFGSLELAPPDQPTLNGTDAPAVGEIWAGGYVAGEVNYGDGRNFVLILADKTVEVEDLQWKTSTDGSLATSMYDGYVNTQAINNVDHPAAQACVSYQGAGYSDWYLPAPDELAVIYANLAPSQTIVPDFLSGSTQALSAIDANDGYWTSLESSNNQAYFIAMSNGTLTSTWKNSVMRVRPVRRVEIILNT